MNTSVRLNPNHLNLETIRKELGLTQKELAKAIGISERSISRYETGLREPVFTISQIKALRRQLKQIGLDIDDLPDSLINQLRKG